MFCYPRGDDDEAEVPLFGHLQVPNSVLDQRVGINFDKVQKTPDHGSDVLRSHVVPDNLITPFACRSVTKKVTFSSSVQVFKVSPVKVFGFELYEELSPEKESFSDNEDEPPSPVIGSRLVQPDIVTPKVETGLLLDCSMADTPIVSRVAVCSRALSFTPEGPNTCKTDLNLQCSEEGSHFIKNPKDVKDDFISYSQMAEMFQESLGTQTGNFVGSDQAKTEQDHNFVPKFSTASGKIVCISEKSLRKAASIIDAALEVVEPIVQPLCDGFQTATGKMIKVSEDSVRKADEILKSVDEPMLIETDKRYSEEAVQPAGLKGTVSKMDSEMIGKGSLVATGFSSASGKAFKVSCKSLMKAKQIVVDDDENPKKDINFETPNRDEGERFTLKEAEVVNKLSSPTKAKGFKPVVRKNTSKTDTSMLAISDDSRPCKAFLDKTDPKEVSSLSGIAISPCDLVKRRNTPFKSPMVAETMKSTLCANSRAWDCQLAQIPPDTETGAYLGMSLLNKIGRIMRVRSNCTGMLSLSDLVLLNNKKSYVTNRSYASFYSFESNHFVLNSSSFKFRVRGFFSERAINCGYAYVADDAKLILDKVEDFGSDELYNAFLSLPDVTRAAASLKWVQNSFRWIIWKLAAYEMCFPRVFGPLTLLNPNSVMSQLKYRFDKEYHFGHRSALRRIIEQDDVPMKCLILFVADCNKSHPPYMEVSDGWYSIHCEIDQCILELIQRGRIKPGQKLAICGAHLLNADVPTEPLEKSDGLRLKVSYNGCRPANWDAKLGFYKYQGSFMCKIGAIRLKGGLVPRIHALVQRVYPVEVSETFENGNVIVKSERQHRRDLNIRLDFVEREMEKNSHSIQSGNWDLSKGFDAEAKIRTVLRVRVTDVDSCSKSALINIWNPCESILDLLKEGNYIIVTNLKPHSSNIFECTANLATTRSSQFLPMKKPINNLFFLPRKLLSCFETKPKENSFAEYDISGIVVRVNDSNDPSVFVCDEFSNIVVVLFLQSLKALALDKLLCLKSVLLFKNLKLCRQSKNLQVLHFEYSAISDVQSCSSDSAAKFSENLTKILTNAQKAVHQLIHGTKLRNQNNSCDRKRPLDSEQKGFEWRMKQLNRYPSPPRSIATDSSLVDTPVAKKVKQEFKSPFKVTVG